LGGVEYRANENVRRFLGVKDEMCLKAEAPVALRQFVNRLADARKVSEKAECALQTRVIGFGLICAKRSAVKV
jgi:hypothetical protein